MYITQETDYAIRILFCLAQAERRKDARAISEEMSVTLRFALKILGKLSAANLVRSYKGNRGGYELGRPPAEISLQDIILVTEGPYVFARCLRDSTVCNRNAADTCVFHRAFIKISDRVNEDLASFTLQQALNGEV